MRIRNILFGAWLFGLGVIYGLLVTSAGASPLPGVLKGYFELRPLTQTGYFGSSLYAYADPGNRVSPGLEARFGKLTLGKVLEPQDRKTALGLESRLYSSFQPDPASTGYLTSIRKGARLSYRATDTLQVVFLEVPIVHLFLRPGTGDGDAAAANKLFENRLAAVGIYSLSDRLSLTIPLIAVQTRYHDFRSGVKNNGAWTYAALLNPELAYQVSSALSVGVSYQSGNLVKEDLSGLALEGFQSGTLQAFLGAAI